jgi:hypothetical protein
MFCLAVNGYLEETLPCRAYREYLLDEIRGKYVRFCMGRRVLLVFYTERSELGRLKLVETWTNIPASPTKTGL